MFRKFSVAQLFSLAAIFLGLIAAPLTSAYGSDTECSRATTVKAKVTSCLEGVEHVRGPINLLDWEVHHLTIEQKVDHNDPNSETFKQRVHLFHKGYDRPMVLATSGYNIFGDRVSEPARLLGANQLLVEHRYFDPSSPENKDWQYMNIVQSAADFHEITVEFKELYDKKWLNTGASKGGMTSIYHRRFYPDDLDASVPYVAPLSFSTADTRYVDFLKNVGGEEFAGCRDKLTEMRREVLKRREKMLPMFSGSFSRLGGKEQALEVAVGETHFLFWQYGKASECASLPGANSSDRALFNRFFDIAKISSFYTDSAIKMFEPYFYQAATELGSPAYSLEELGSLIRHPRAFQLSLLTPAGAELNYNPNAMVDIDEWVQNESEKILHIYGEFDPWTAGKFRLGTSTERDSHEFTVPQGNHGATISQLTESDQLQAKAILSRWMEVEIQDAVDYTPEEVSLVHPQLGARP